MTERAITLRKDTARRIRNHLNECHKHIRQQPMMKERCDEPAKLADRVVAPGDGAAEPGKP